LRTVPEDLAVKLRFAVRNALKKYSGRERTPARRGSSCNRTKKDHRIIQLKHKNAVISTFLCFSSKQIRIIPIINCTKKDHRIAKDEHSQLSARFNARSFPFSRSLSY
jgi:hypothetical protein